MPSSSTLSKVEFGVGKVSGYLTDWPLGSGKLRVCNQYNLIDCQVWCDVLPILSKLKTGTVFSEELGPEDLAVSVSTPLLAMKRLRANKKESASMLHNKSRSTHLVVIHLNIISFLAVCQFCQCWDQNN